MELLSPAGNFEQVIAGINGGCNAIYGGLKAWNARNRAQNFTLEEYKRVIDYCKERNVKFYLTLNTALRDKEIDVILDLFSSKDFVMPDAVILSDMGLAKVLIEKFPKVIIHASTQFGAHCIDDIKYLEAMRVKRVILSREVFMEDIKKIKSNTSLEVEVFIYGSQCIGFSGKCYWGGMVLGGSGNRGRCIGLCRDIYSYKGELGQFFYSKDLDAVSKVKELENIGVSSVKIEGRMRKPDEIYEIVSSLRKAIDSEKKTINGGYCGYLDNQLPVKGLIERVNSRSRKLAINASDISNYDKIIRCDDVEGLLFEKNSDSYYEKGKNWCYKTGITNKVIIDGKNIAFKLFVNDSNIIEKIDFINEYGERNLFILADEINNMAEESIDGLYEYFSDQLSSFNIYEFTFPKLKLNSVRFNKNELKDFIDKIRMSCIKNKINGNLNQIGLYDRLVIEIKDLNAIESITHNGIKSIIYNIGNYYELLKVLDIYKYDTRIIYKLPLFDWNSKGLSMYFDALEGQNIMITRWSQLQYLSRRKFNSISADYTLNCWNKQSVEILKKHGVQRVTGSPELSAEENIQFANKSYINLELIFAGKMPLIYSRHCFKEMLNCSLRCSEAKEVTNSEKGLAFKLYCREEHRELIFDIPIIADINKINSHKDTTFRYIACFDNIDVVKQTVKGMLNNKDYKGNLIENENWANHYMGNFMESVR